ncbi:hypothetical protein DdX_00712 [Ditylenchus destructor]|uniref:Uncharacterized protein n=1 Tax=Ditylenchus destructor TaxID=166010 RepID=A0AAD4RAM0_9BILA|nr:hypothetical protein DdX_00712 [Ditylenchus destructor]
MFLRHSFIILSLLLKNHLLPIILLFVVLNPKVETCFGGFNGCGTGWTGCGWSPPAVAPYSAWGGYANPAYYSAAPIFGMEVPAFAYTTSCCSPYANNNFGRRRKRGRPFSALLIMRQKRSSSNASKDNTYAMYGGGAPDRENSLGNDVVGDIDTNS